jgi:hypothetical protein
MMRSHPFRPLLTGLALAVAAASCASDDGADTGEGATTDMTAVAEDEPTTEAVTATDDATSTDVGEDEPTTEAVTATDEATSADVGEEPVDDEAAIEAYCQKNDELVAVRGPVYGPPFTESPDEIEAMLAEAAVLQEELDLLVPDEIRQEHDLHMAEFNAPIDALTEELGWDPYAAINTEEAAAIFADPEINAATEVLLAFLVEHCGLEPPPGG